MQSRLYAKAIRRLLVQELDNYQVVISKSPSETAKQCKLCLHVVTELKKKYPHIRRIYVRAEFPYIDESYTSYLLKRYDHTYYPERMLNAGMAAYVERNYEMIDNSSYCVIYYDENYMPPRRKNSRRDLFDYQPSSGTKLAYDYAVKKNLKILNIKNSLSP